MIKTFLLRQFFKLIKKTPADMPMVQYWKTKNAVEAKITEKDGVICMVMDGEKYTYPGFPRGHILFGYLSKLKHEIKNQIFNESWVKLDKGVPEEQVIQEIKTVTLPKLFSLFEINRLDILPPRRLVKPVREIHRAWTKTSPGSTELRDLILFILQEDDSYRFRFQWIVSYMPTFLFKFVNPIPYFEKAMEQLENAEVIGDMKERIRLFRRAMMMVLRDPEYRTGFIKLFREINWNKIKLSKADKYFFRGKYFKVDLNLFDY